METTAEIKKKISKTNNKIECLIKIIESAIAAAAEAEERMTAASEAAGALLDELAIINQDVDDLTPPF